MPIASPRQDGLIGGRALFDGAFRYSLIREWEPDAARAAFVLLNPSTADASNDDPTVRRCQGFARRMGAGSLEVVNIFAYRATDPRDLHAAYARGDDIVGPRNDRAIVRALRRAEFAVLAWGGHGGLGGRAAEVLQLLDRRGLLERCSCLGTTASGEPRHPLYLRADTRRVSIV
ncbi:MAG: DUF1643 domain-containing protein [Planctomycetota bacterium]